MKTNLTQPSLKEIVKWLTSITKPVHKPLLISSVFRIINLVTDFLLFAVAGGGVVALILNQANATTVFTALIVASLTKAIAFYFEQFSGHFVAFKALELLRTYAFAKLWPKAPAIVSHSHSGDVLASLTRDVDRIEVFYAHTFAPLVAALIAPLTILSGVGILYGWELALIPLICVLISLLILPLIGTKKAFAATQETLLLRRKLAHHVTDSVSGISEVVGYNQETNRLEAMTNYENSVTQRANYPRTIVALRRAVNAALMLISVTGIVLIGLKTGFDPIIVAAVATGSLRLFEGPRGVEDALGYLDHSIAAARRLWTISNAPQQVTDGENTYTPTQAPTVTWENVTYQYRDENGEVVKTALENINLTAPAGKRTVILGVSGSGKSTAAQLLLRFDDPTQGTIKLDAVPVTDYTLDSLRQNVVLVTQKNQHLNADIATNLRLGAPEATDAQLWEVLETVGLKAEIEAMPAGLKTEVGQGGTKLSGGQSQRLALGRSLLMQPKVLVLDEFSANLNTQLEKEIRENLARNYPGTTVIEITHRLESVKHADQVALIDDGKLVEKGSVAQLLAANGEVYRLLNRDVNE
ncbi:ABC transporter ATP-binding protein/permease [Gleimia sp. 6138-11-ORH1]|uniref:amino acid ABC transporter ATP-binding/permease protein n=1 Tax=Gleimia sp. 6138-11-ORH1 TaxID=2973937 RepID=UPI002168B89D|nr:ABC transporter ATP-binding protein [Gleimia sp. 6138-11-ORH1]MCS4484896.1 ABC transporter ATP-binding protein/permease [Gleimia sp. 6138-11-ORH1]